ncbi:MAG: tetratricopeptide repeat protein [Chloroflexaceae bacterium]|nr:tetratricopeptide repeat protein [Chloroflexaceae bacterium]
MHSLDELHQSIQLALDSYAQGDYRNARSQCEQALTISEQVTGSEQPDTIAVLNTLALLLRDLGDYVVARSLAERALALCEGGLAQSTLRISCCAMDRRSLS